MTLGIKQGDRVEHKGSKFTVESIDGDKANIVGDKQQLTTSVTNPHFLRPTIDQIQRKYPGAQITHKPDYIRCVTIIDYMVPGTRISVRTDLLRVLESNKVE